MRHALRTARVEDLGFLIKPWLQELRTAPSAQYVEDGLFFQEEGTRVKRLLDTECTLVAHDPEDDAHLYGFICFREGFTDEGVVHWAYVKSTYRNMGLGKALLHAALGEDYRKVVCSYASGLFGLRELRAKYKLVYNPYVLRGL